MTLHVLKRKQIMWLPPSWSKQFGLVQGPASFWATWRSRKVHILLSPLMTSRLHITQISSNFYDVCAGAWPKKRTNIKSRLPIRSHADFRIIRRTRWTYDEVILIWQPKLTHITSQSLTQLMCIQRKVVQGYWNPGLQVAVAIKFSTVALNIRGSSIWNVPHPTLLTPRHMNWVPYFRKKCVLLK
jgi:hypothetical protein